jgi:hypothetical protein
LGNVFNEEDNLASFLNETPILLINDFTESENILQLEQLVNLFKRDGYHTVALSEFTIGILFGFEYVPHNGYFTDITAISTYIKSMARAFDPDLLIIVTKDRMPTHDYSQILKLDLEPDIVLNFLQSEDDIELGNKYADKKVINIFTDVREDKTGLYSLNEIKKKYQHIIETFESDK